MKPRLLDLFCGAGGAAMGYAGAGFEVVGVDIDPQPRFPFEFHHRGSLAVLEHYLRYCDTKGMSDWPFGGEFDAIHASPPCQAFSKLKVLWAEREHQDLVGVTRTLLRQVGLPYVIENVDGAPLPRQNDLFGAYGIELCGSMFDLEVRRHRLFETSFPVESLHCRHETQAQVVGVYGHTGAGANRGRARANGQSNLGSDWRRAMGVDWTMTNEEIAEAIPPAYTEFLGRQLREHIETKAAA